MTEDQDKKDEERFEFTADGEVLGYISSDQASVLAMRTARESPGDYGRRFRGTPMAFEVVEGEDTEDHYVITLSFRPQGQFTGNPGQEQFFIEKVGVVAHRQVLSVPRPRRLRRIPVTPVTLVLLGVIIAVAVGAVLVTNGGGGKDEAPLAANVTGPTATQVPPAAPTPPAASEPGISTGPRLWPGNGHYYEVVLDDRITWSRAKELADSSSFKGLQGHLATIGSQEENDWIAGDPKFMEGASVLAGGVQTVPNQGPTSDWRWVTGEPWSFTAPNWGQGEPNDDGGEERYLELHPDGYWNDAPRNSGGYVVEFEHGAKVVYRDTRYKATWFHRRERTIIVDYLDTRGYGVVDADELKAYMTEKGTGTCVVFAQDMAPDTVVDDPARPGRDSLIRDYMQRGGRVVWPGHVPLYAVGLPDGTVIEQVGGSENVLGIAWVADDNNVEVSITESGSLWGLTQSWRSLRPSSGIVSQLATIDRRFSAAAFHKNFGGPPLSGFVRIWDTRGLDLLANPAYMEDLDRMCDSKVWAVLGEQNFDGGLRQREFGDGLTEATVRDGRPCRLMVENGTPARFMYFDVLNDFIFAEPTEVVVTVDYFDDAAGALGLNYDSTDLTGGLEGRFRGTFNVEFLNTNTWKTVTFEIDDAYFGNRQHDNFADFRIGGPVQDVCIAQVTLSR